MARYAGVDLGATRIRAVVGDGDGTVRGRDRRPTPQAEDGAEIATAVVGALRAACESANVAPTDLRGVGIGSIGPLDRKAGVVTPPNVAADRIELAAPVTEFANTERVVLHNDCVAGVIAERRHGAPENVVYLTLSTGVGAGACVDGNVLSGRDGNAAEMGHVTLDPEGRMACACGGRGHWEAYCSGENIPAYARQLHDGEPTSLPIDGDLSAADVYGAAPDDPFAAQVVNRVAEWNVRGIAAIVHAYAPEGVAVGGSVALENPELVVAPMAERVPDHLAVEPPSIRTTGLGDEAVVRGALASVLP